MQGRNVWSTKGLTYKALLKAAILLLILLAACTEPTSPQPPPQSITTTPTTAPATSTAAPATATNSPITPTTQPLNPTPARAEPTATPTITPTPTLVPLGSFSPCPVDETGNATTATGPLHVLIFNDAGAWRWSDESGITRPVPLPPDAHSPVPSPDGDRFAYTLEPQEGQVQLWVMDENGANRRQLAQISIAAYLAGSPDYVADAVLSYHWLADRELLAYAITPILNAMGDVPLEPVTIADANSGESWPLAVDGDVDRLIYHPEGIQVAALSDDRVQIVDTLNGARLLDVTLPLHNFWYSAAFAPSGAGLIIFTEVGVALVDTQSGAVQSTALDYSPIGMGHHALMPEIIWERDGQRFYTLIAGGNDVEAIFGPASTFTLWRITLQPFAAEELDTFQGSLFSARLSPDRQRLAFWSQRQDNVRTLYLANLPGGEQVAYERLHTLEFLDWHPDSTRFTYWQFPERAPIVGHFCQQPEPLGDLTIPFAGAIYWLDSDRFISVEGARAQIDQQVIAPWQIRLRSVDGDNQLLHTVEEGAAPLVRFGP